MNKNAAMNKHAAMNEVFSFSRWGRLFIKHTMEHYRTYLMSVAVLTGVLVLGGCFVFFLLPFPPDPGFQSAIFMLLLFIAGAIFTSTVFADYGEKNKSIPALTLPATALEKFVVGWLWSYPIFMGVFTGSFYLALYGLGSMRHWAGNQHFYPLNVWDPGMIIVFVMYSIVHALSLWGSIFFRKLQFIKTGFAFFICLGVIILLNILLLKMFTGLKDVMMALPFGNLNFVVPHHLYSLQLTDAGSVKLILWVMMLSAVLIWVAAYFRLKEKQV